MVKRDKLIRRLESEPSDLEFAELEKILNGFGFLLRNKGKTSGSRVSFINARGVSINLHKPHGGRKVARYQIRQVLDVLRSEGLLK